MEKLVSPLITGAFILFLASCSQTLTSPNSPPLLQSHIHKNACGPCASVHAFSYASPKWRNGEFFNKTREEQAEAIISDFGRLPSGKSTRWNPQKGISTADLAKTIDEITKDPVSYQTLFFNNSVAINGQIKKFHKNLQNSLDKGFPPILSLKQQKHKKLNSKAGYYWIATKGHFVTLISVSSIRRDQFHFEYVDSLTGSKHKGIVPLNTVDPILTTTPFSRKQVKRVWLFPQVILPDQALTPKNFERAGTLTHDLDAVILAK